MHPLPPRSSRERGSLRQAGLILEGHPPGCIGSPGVGPATPDPASQPGLAGLGPAHGRALGVERPGQGLAGFGPLGLSLVVGPAGPAGPAHGPARTPATLVDEDTGAHHGPDGL